MKKTRLNFACTLSIEGDFSFAKRMNYVIRGSGFFPRYLMNLAHIDCGECQSLPEGAEVSQHTEF